MKNVLILFLALLMNVTFVWGQEDCSKYYPVRDGAKFEISLYDDKMKEQGKVTYSVDNDGGDTVLYTMEITDDKSGSVASSQYGMTCKDDGVSIDFKSMMGSGMGSRFTDMEVEVTGDNIYLPNNLTVGDVLPDASMEIDVKGMPVAMKSFIKMTNRKVEGRESITTPAGTFDCLIISYNTEFKMGVKNVGQTKQWLAEDVGMVKSQDYNKKGKLRSISLLTAYNL